MDIDGFELSDACAVHILEGNFSNEKTAKIQISGGLHGYEALRKFLSKRTDLENLSDRSHSAVNQYWYHLSRFENGVSFIRLPTIVFTKKALRNTANAERYLSSSFSSKTIFPKGFSRPDLVKLISEVIQSSYIKTHNKGSIDSAKKEKSICGVGTYNGKKIYAEVIFHEQKITTCFPTVDQGERFKDKQNFREMIDYISNQHHQLDYSPPFFDLDTSNFMDDVENKRAKITDVLKIKTVSKAWGTYKEFEVSASEYDMDDVFENAVFCKNPYDLDFYMDYISQNSNKFSINALVLGEFQKKVLSGLKELSRSDIDSMIRLIRLYDKSCFDPNAFDNIYNFELCVGGFLNILDNENDTNSFILSCLNSPLLHDITRSFAVVEALTEKLRDNSIALNRDYLDPLVLKIIRANHNCPEDYFDLFKKEVRRYLGASKDKLGLLSLAK